MKKTGKIVFPLALMLVLTLGASMAFSPPVGADTSTCPSLICPSNLSGWTLGPVCEIYESATNCRFYYETYKKQFSGRRFTCRVLEDTGIMG